jgi:hypothetical protein
MEDDTKLKDASEILPVQNLGVDGGRPQNRYWGSLADALWKTFLRKIMFRHCWELLQRAQNETTDFANVEGWHFLIVPVHKFGN